MAEWQNRPLDAVYPLGTGQDPVRGFGRLHRARHSTRWQKEILAVWIEQTEGAKFWLRVMNELKEPRRRRHPHCPRRRPEGFSRGDQRGQLSQIEAFFLGAVGPKTWTVHPYSTKSAERTTKSASTARSRSCRKRERQVSTLSRGGSTPMATTSIWSGCGAERSNSTPQAKWTRRLPRG
ncbi:hypothetical protein [Mesorhizobium sp.]|uniref:transposase n=1 Tax=Mesorhizobium sp. TaxID=1871066 RepID=UPI00351A9EB7